ncbi:MAG TPA: SAM-dependent methyltransferase [Trebonia sp.]
MRDAARRYGDSGADPYPLRGPDQLARFFEGLELVPPGLATVPQWRPGPAADREPESGAFSYCAVGRKPR